MKKIAVFPGSFDPITKGHEALVLRSASLFDEIIVAIGSNTSKSNLFTLDKRFQWVTETFANVTNVRVEIMDGLTVDFCIRNNAQYILRGLRNSGDFEYERSIAHMNKAMMPPLETIFLFADPGHISLSSSIIREIIKNKGQVSQFLPDLVDVYA
jgi:pantetheine-phosphate adenylyltransferase